VQDVVAVDRQAEQEQQGRHRQRLDAATGAQRAEAHRRQPSKGSRRRRRHPEIVWHSAIVAHPVPRDWLDLFITDGDHGAPAPQSEQPERRRGFFRRLRENLSKTREALGAEIQATLFETLDDETWERLEEALIMADVGAATTAKVVARLETEASSGELEGGEALSRRLTELLADMARLQDGASARIDLRHEPTVIMAVGVNGTGKTTTIGKLAWHLQNELGLRVLMGAADTFRAAAVEQLEGWARRAGCDIVTGPEGADPGSVAFESVRRGREEGYDVVIVDTAGRLHNQDHLMAELAKVRRVVAKQLPDAPHETLLTVDATTGQNGLRQAQLFSQAVPVTGIVLTKLDGTAKGGIALAIAGELGIPVKLIGIGEALEDLRPFDPDDFARALVAPEAAG
jgi:fused signal recognition particle receptor